MTKVSLPHGVRIPPGQTFVTEGVEASSSSVLAVICAIDACSVIIVANLYFFKMRAGVQSNFASTIKQHACWFIIYVVFIDFWFAKKIR